MSSTGHTITEATNTVATLLREELPRQHAALLQFARKLVRDKSTAEDLVQETMARALSKSDQFRPGSNLRAWLMRILATRCSDGWRHEQVRRSLRARDLLAGVKTFDDDDSEPSALDLFTAEDVHRALGCLTRSQRELFVLRYVDRLSYRQITLRCGVKGGTLGVRLLRVRARLRDTLLASRGSVTPLPTPDQRNHRRRPAGDVITSAAKRDGQRVRSQAAFAPRLAVRGSR